MPHLSRGPVEPDGQEVLVGARRVRQGLNRGALEEAIACPAYHEGHYPARVR